MSELDTVPDIILADLIPSCFHNPETQAIIIAGLAVLGVWFLVYTLIQLFLMVLWPFFLVAGALILMPSWRDTLVHDILPYYRRVFGEWLEMAQPYVNAAVNFIGNTANNLIGRRSA